MIYVSVFMFLAAVALVSCITVIRQMPYDIPAPAAVAAVGVAAFLLVTSTVLAIVWAALKLAN